MAKRLYRSTTSKVIGGVCGGLGEYFNIDPVLVRIIAVLLVFANGIGLLAYIVCWIAMPRGATATADSNRSDAQVEPEPAKSSPWLGYLPGLILICLGTIFLVDRLFWWFRWSLVWPSLIILVGVIVLVTAIMRRQSDSGGVHESIQN